MRTARSATLRIFRNKSAFTLLELLAAIAIIIVLMALLLPAVTKSVAKARQVECLSHLRQIGLAMTSFAHDHSGRYPMQISNLEGGSLWANRDRLPASHLLSFSARHFQVLSNELSSAKLVLCPTDKKKEAPNFASLTAAQMSYWVFYPASPGNSTHPLAGDWNVQSVTTNGSVIGARTNLLSIRFSDQLHQFRGNILFADGRVELVRNIDLSPNTGPSSLQKETRPVYPTSQNVRNGAGRSQPELTGGMPQSTIKDPSARNLPDKQLASSTTTPLSESAGSANSATNELSAAGTNVVSYTNTHSTTGSSAGPNPALAPSIAVSSRSGKTIAISPGAQGGLAAPEIDPEMDDDRMRRIRQAQLAIKASFLLGIVLMILGFIWYYLHRRRREKEKDKSEELAVVLEE
jgi:prepilin-type processing-associated H-X9-DG protein